MHHTTFLVALLPDAPHSICSGISSVRHASVLHMFSYSLPARRMLIKTMNLVHYVYIPGNLLVALRNIASSHVLICT